MKNALRVFRENEMANLGLKISQEQRQMMTLAPQMRQSLEMLQMPVMELREVITKEMETNPTLEMSDPAEVAIPSFEAPSGAGRGTDYFEGDPTPDEPKPSDTEEAMNFDPTVDGILRIHDDGSDYFLQNLQNADSLADAEEKRQYRFDSIRQKVSLQDYLLEQLHLTTLSGSDYEVATTLIGDIDRNGYFTGSLPDIVMISGKSEREILAILKTIQRIAPPGVGARTLRECLLLQMDRFEDSPWEDEIRLLIDKYLDKLAAHDEKFLCKALHLNREELAQVIKQVTSLDPRPGLQFEETEQRYVEPEVFVVKKNGRYIAQVEDRLLPHIHISKLHERMLQDPSVSAETKSYIREKIRSANFFVKSIEQRQETIRKIAQTIVDAQTEFFTQGVKALKPMTMASVAQKVNVHETTVSRTVANKYMRTPIGVFEMKYFFTPGIMGQDGTTVSNKSIQKLIRDLVDAEDPTAPLSDQAIEKKLAEQGFKVARRTINKYRGILKIPPAYERRRT